MNAPDNSHSKDIVRGDFHLHTCYSFDCNTTLSQVIDRCERSGINCVAITDHDTIEGALRLREIAPFQVIIGEEISSQDGHIIGLFLEELIPPGLSTQETVRRIKQQGGIAVAPHPFARLADASLQQACTENAALFDSIEVANSNNFLRADDRRAAQFAERLGLPPIAGSDAHRPNGIGSNIVELAPFHSPQQFVSNLHSAKIFNSLHPFSYFVEMGIHDMKERIREAATRFGYTPKPHLEASA